MSNKTSSSSLSQSMDSNQSYVGFANLPNQVHRKFVKKGFEFTLMVLGESGLGKSTLINSLFLTDLYPERIVANTTGRLTMIILLFSRLELMIYVFEKIKLNVQLV